MKKNLQLIIVLTVFSVLLVSCAGGGTPVDENADQAVITVTGTGQVFVIPDVANISVGVRTKGDTVSEAIALNNDQAQAIKNTLMAEGVAENDIQTSNFNVYQQSDYDFQGNPTSIYYSVENTVYVIVRQIENLGNILDAVGRSGANNIYGVNFDVEDKSEAQTNARALAVQSAQAQALELANAAGVEMGELISISSGATTTSPNYYGYGVGGGGAMAESVPISSGQLPVNAQVTLTFAIK